MRTLARVVVPDRSIVEWLDLLSHGLTKEREAPRGKLTRPSSGNRRCNQISRSSRSSRSMIMAQKKFHSGASRFLSNRYIAGDPKREEEYDEEVVNAEIARNIYQLRT